MNVVSLIIVVIAQAYSYLVIQLCPPDLSLSANLINEPKESASASLKVGSFSVAALGICYNHPQRLSSQQLQRQDGKILLRLLRCILVSSVDRCMSRSTVEPKLNDCSKRLDQL